MQINDLIHSFTSNLPSQPNAQANASSSRHVILTGSTGALGSYILSSLLQDDSISCIFCLNRSKDSKSKQTDSFKQKGLSSDLLPAKAKFLQIDLAKENLGIPHSTYMMLVNQVDTIVHNAWEVNWLLPLEVYQHTHIRGVRSLVDFALQSPQHPHLFFVSSAATFYRWAERYSTAVPEALVDDCATCLEMGYAQSKYVAERVIETASSLSGLQSTILRVGQISGPTSFDGMWNLDDCIPGLLATSIALGQIPKLEGQGGSINWVPSDMAGNIVTDLVRHRQQEQDPPRFTVFNDVNPTPVPWLLLASTMQEMYPIEVVSMDSWVKTLKEKVTASPKDRQLYPAIELIDLLEIWFRDGGIRPFQIETSLARSASPTLNTLQPVGRKLLLNWFRQWDLFPELVLYG